MFKPFFNFFLDNRQRQRERVSAGLQTYRVRPGQDRHVQGGEHGDRERGPGGRMEAHHTP